MSVPILPLRCRRGRCGSGGGRIVMGQVPSAARPGFGDQPPDGPPRARGSRPGAGGPRSGCSAKRATVPSVRGHGVRLGCGRRVHNTASGAQTPAPVQRCLHRAPVRARLDGQAAATRGVARRWGCGERRDEPIDDADGQGAGGIPGHGPAGCRGAAWHRSCTGPTAGHGPPWCCSDRRARTASPPHLTASPATPGTARRTSRRRRRARRGSRPRRPRRRGPPARGRRSSRSRGGGR